MVLDTRWKKFKFSNGNKALCVLMALVMAAVFVINGFALVKCTAWFFYDDDLMNTEDRSFYNSYIFTYNINMDISAAAEQVNYNSNVKKYEEAKAEFVEKAMTLYREEESKNRLTVQEVSAYIEMLGSPAISDYDFNYYYDVYEGELLAYYNIYEGDDGNYYQNDFNFSTLATADYNSGNMNFGHTDEKARELLVYYFHNDKYYSYISDNYYWRKLDDLKNISYYAENDDGSVLTNVKDGAALVNSIRNGEGDYIAFENGKVLLSESLEGLREHLWNSGNSSCRIYFSINSDFSGDDVYAVMFSEYSRLASVDVMETVTAMAIAFIAMIVFAVMSVRLAGNTADGIKIAAIDKVPHDLHLAAICGLIWFAGLAIVFLVDEYGEIIQYDYYNDFASKFFTSKLFEATLIALAGTIYLLILEFATSIARSIKAERTIIKKSLIGMIFRNGGKWLLIVLKFIFVDIVGGFFKLIGKLFKIILRLGKTVALKPKRLEKKLVSATVLYTLFNFVSVGIIVSLFINYRWYGDARILFAIAGIITLPLLDVYVVYRAMKYLKALDDIIDSSAKREPLPYETDKLPPSLKTLAESLEATNAELQEAVLKAVKDERTKAELITNVSHDLKTPLTSVINYIDLLQKCDIEDETAKQYMAVIEEKSGKLKRLIEDLIEASKVSTGNVTLNKTNLNLSELASQAIVEETSDIEKNNLQIIFDEAPNKHIVFADGTKIYRVFENLLSNARKYSAPYTRIYASVYSDDNAGYFEIKNISKDPLNISAEELTERFVRGDKSRSEEGNGLGLSIARELCKLNGGDLVITIDGDLFKATVKLPKENTKE